MKTINNNNKKVRLVTYAFTIAVVICVVMLFAIIKINNIPNVVQVLMQHKAINNNIVECNNYLNENYPISNNRLDFSSLNDDQFANFRSFSIMDRKSNFLFLSSTPFSNQYNRDVYVKDCIAQNNIQIIINTTQTINLKLSDLNIECVDCPITEDFSDETTKQSIKKIFNIIENSNSKILLFSDDGIENICVVESLLSCLNNSFYDNIKQDYFLSNYCMRASVDKALNNNHQYKDMLDLKFRSTLQNVFGVPSEYIRYINLNRYTLNYLKSCDIDSETINKVKAKFYKD